MLPYIYKITNLLNNKTYIGKSNGKDKYYYTGGKIIKKAIYKYGKENFLKEIIIQGDFNNTLLNELEKHYIRLYSPSGTKNSYNITSGGQGIEGLKHSEESKIKISNASKISSNRKENLEYITNLKYWKGKKTFRRYSK